MENGGLTIVIVLTVLIVAAFLVIKDSKKPKTTKNEAEKTEEKVIASGGFSMRDIIEGAILVLAYLSLIAGVILIIMCFTDKAESGTYLLYGVSCLISSVFTFGFSYVVTAANIIISEREKKE